MKQGYFVKSEKVGLVNAGCEIPADVSMGKNGGIEERSSDEETRSLRLYRLGRIRRR